MPEPEVKPWSISGATSIEELSEYWDTHDLPDDAPDVTDQVEIRTEALRHLVAVDPDLLQEARAAARERGISVQTLVNLAIRQAITPRGPGPRA